MSANWIGEELAPRKETFDRRKRHKTNEHRYDQSKRPRPDGSEESRRTNHKKVKRGESQRVVRRAGEELMRKFSSSHLADTRLTVSAINFTENLI